MTKKLSVLTERELIVVLACTGIFNPYLRYKYFPTIHTVKVRNCLLYVYALRLSAMTDYKGCDVHKTKFPNNLVPAENTYALELSQPATINKRKGTKILRADMCHEDAIDKILSAMTALGIKPKWVFSYWGTYQKDDGSEGRKQFEEPLDSAQENTK